MIINLSFNFRFMHFFSRLEEGTFQGIFKKEIVDYIRRQFLSEAVPNFDPTTPRSSFEIPCSTFYIPPPFYDRVVPQKTECASVKPYLHVVYFCLSFQLEINVT